MVHSSKPNTQPYFAPKLHYVSFGSFVGFYSRLPARSKLRGIRRSRIIFLFCFLLSGCATVNLPNAGEKGYSLEEDEKRLYKRAEEDIEIIDSSDAIYHNQALEDYLTNLANQLLPAQVKQGGVTITVRVIKDASLNAFTLPNGRIYIHTGLLSAMDNEAQLAVLLGHEMTHALHRHALKSFRSLQNRTAVLATLTTPITAVSGNLGTVFTELAAVSSIYGYSQNLEYEADENGFQMLKEHGYDRDQAVKLFEHLKEFITDEDEKEPFFFSTHPHVLARIKNYQQLIKKEGPQPQNVKIDSDTFKHMMDTVRLDNVSYCFQKGFFKTAEKNIATYLKQHPDAAQGYFLRAELNLNRQDKQKASKTREKTEDFVLALQDYDKAISLDKGLVEAYRGKAKVLQKQNKKDEAKALFKKYLELNPSATDRAYIEPYLKE